MKVYPARLTRAASLLADQLEEYGKPVISSFEFYRIVRAIYQHSSGKRLYLRRATPNQEDIARFRSILRSACLIASDRDYGSRIIRVLNVSDLPADEIVCLVDPTCYISHLSAMQRWGLTNRAPYPLMLTRPDRKTAIAALRTCMRQAMGEAEDTLYQPKLITHPPLVRRRKIWLHESTSAGECLTVQGEKARLSTMGQTFLDMLQKPFLCGGMRHVMDVWEEYAEQYLEFILSAVDRSPKAIVKCRAGYILQEYLGLSHPLIEKWKDFGQRGGSRKLDPDRNFEPKFSETWKISINL